MPAPYGRGLPAASGTHGKLRCPCPAARCHPPAPLLVDARVPLCAPPGQHGINVFSHRLFLDTLELYVVLAVCWVLRMLVRSSGQLGLLLGFFIVTFVRVLSAWTASSTPASRSLIGPAPLYHRVRMGLGDGAATTLQAAPPTADLMRSRVGRGAGPPSIS